MAKCIAFVPARGGSKSIPLKNIKRLHGQPLIFWSVQELIKAKYVDEIWVSTDSEEIEKTVSSINQEKVKVFQRSPEFAKDHSSTEDAMFEFINAKKLEDELMMLVQATSPFTLAEHFDEAIERLHSSNYDSLLSVVETKRFFWGAEGIPLNYDYRRRPRRQDFNPYYLENGAFYINKAANITANRNRLSGNIGYYIMPEYSGIEIDEELDWKLAESIMKSLDFKPTLSLRKKIKLFATDVDGVLTDAGMYYSEQGDEIKKFNTRDGKGFELLRNEGIKTAVITTENTEMVTRRAMKLKVDYIYQGRENHGKLDAIKEICKKENINLSQVAYIGDDLNCKEVLEAVGFPSCPKDASAEILNIENILVIDRIGGQGAVRKFSEIILGNET